jgi:hypothetical protein
MQSLMDQIVAEKNAEAAAILNADAAFARHYTGPVSLKVISGSERLDYVETELTQAAAGREGLWLIHIPDIYPEIYETLAEELAVGGGPTIHLTAGDLSADYYPLAQNVSWVAETPQVATDYRLGDSIRLLGLDPPASKLAPGDTATMRLYWRADQPVEGDWKVFVHVVGPDGAIYAQADAVPQGFSRPPSTWTVGQVIPDDYEFEIPANAPAGEYTVAIGMYNADSGERLVATGADGTSLGDQVTLWPVDGGQ